MKYTLTIDISNVEVSEGYYSFDYSWKLGAKKGKAHYESDYDNGMSEKQWKNALVKRYALEMALEDLAGRNLF